jgi:hypothetical protein
MDIEERVICNEMIDTFIYHFKKKTQNQITEEEEKLLRLMAKSFARFILEEYNNVRDEFYNIYEEELAKVYNKKSDTDETNQKLEDELHRDLNKILDSGRC